MIEKPVNELRSELKVMCEKYGTSYSGMEYLVNYYINSLNWTEKDALEYALGLFHDGTITQLNLINKNVKEVKK